MQLILKGRNVHREVITKRNVSVFWPISVRLILKEQVASVTTKTSANAKMSSAKVRLTTPASTAMTSRHAPVLCLAEEK